MNVMNYKDYAARIEYSDEDGLLIGHIAGIRDVVGFHAESVAELRAAFEEAVEDYLETCAKLGRELRKPIRASLVCGWSQHYTLPWRLKLSLRIKALISGSATYSVEKLAFSFFKTSGVSGTPLIYSIAQIRFVNRLITVGGALVLGGPDGFAAAEVVVGVEWPVRVTQQFAGQQDQVGLAGAQDVFGLRRFSNHANGSGGDAGLFAHALGKACLVAWADRDLCFGRSAARRHINQVHTQVFQAPRQLDGFVRVPAVLYPIGGRNTHEQRQLLRPDRPNSFGDLQGQTNTVFE